MSKRESSDVRRALYRKYRPRSLDEIVSQNHATEILRRSLSAGRISHAYLLTGPKGVGKTSIARILAHEINQLPYKGDDSHLDIIEIDAASNNGVDDVRELRDRVMIAPTSANKKIYIVDEVHMLSKPAFNALLKTLEEPPEHVVFILATTDLHKVPDTIISRTQHFAFRAISREDLASHLKKIAKGEGIKIDDGAIELIAARGDGSFRNAIGLLDQLSGYADDNEGITKELVESTLGFAPAQVVDALIEATKSNDARNIVETLDNLEKQGIQPHVLTDQLLEMLRAEIPNQPSPGWQIRLIDDLLAVNSSSRPGLKLLTTLMLATTPSPTATVPANKPPVNRAVEATKKPVKPTIIEAPVIVVKEKVPAEPITNKPPKKVVKSDQPFDSKKLLDYTRQNQVALYSVLSKCQFEYDEDRLTIYCGRKFSKSKLDEAKYQSQLGEALNQIGYPETNVTTLAHNKPPADEKLAKIAEMMGGGTEVKLDD